MKYCNTKNVKEIKNEIDRVDAKIAELTARKDGIITMLAEMAVLDKNLNITNELFGKRYSKLDENELKIYNTLAQRICRIRKRNQSNA